MGLKGEQNNFMYTYVWYHWLTFFYLYCFFGWIFESTYVSLRERRPVNRGFLRLPMLPLYGTGAVMMLWVSLPVKDNLFLVYLSGVVAATILEYITGAAMERLFKVKYWDYSDQRFNYNGYICLSSSIAWGFLTILMTEVIHRPIERLVLRMNPVFEGIWLSVLSILFLADVIQSTRDALDLARALEAATKLRGELDDLQVQLALLKAETTQSLQELLDAHEARIYAMKTTHEKKLQNLKNLKNIQETALQVLKEAHEEQLRILKEAQDEKLRIFKESRSERIRRLSEQSSEKAALLRQNLSFRRSAILRRNPSASSRHFAAALKELKETINSRKAS